MTTGNSRRIWGASVAVTFLIIAGCANQPAITQQPTTRLTPTVSPTASPPTSTATPAASIIGTWHRAQSCEEMHVAFESAGLAESHREWLQGNFFGGEPGPSTGDPCAGAEGPLEHSHFFTAAGEFGSHDENGEQVDDGDYVVIDSDTLSFPSHATEFGYAAELSVDFVIAGENVTFDVVLPQSCVDECADAYAWALSAFASGPWERGEIP